MDTDDPTPRKRTQRPAASQPGDGLAAARRIWAGPFGPYLLKQALLAGVVSLAWVGVSWIAVLISFIVVLTVSLLVRAHFIRRYGKGDQTPAGSD